MCAGLLLERSSPDFTLSIPSQRFRSSVQPCSELMSMKGDKPDLIRWSIEEYDEPRDWRAGPWYRIAIVVAANGNWGVRRDFPETSTRR